MICGRCVERSSSAQLSGNATHQELAAWSDNKFRVADNSVSMHPILEHPRCDWSSKVLVTMRPLPRGQISTRHSPPGEDAGQRAPAWLRIAGEQICEHASLDELRCLLHLLEMTVESVEETRLRLVKKGCKISKDEPAFPGCYVKDPLA